MGSRSAWRDVGIGQERRIVHRMGQHMMEMRVLHMLQGCLQYVEELISWTEDETIVDDLGGWLPGWYVVRDDNDFRWRRM